MLRVGLTGGFSAGKSLVSRMLHDHFGIAIVDVDAAGRRAVNDHPEISSALRQAFGDAYFMENGALNRKKLGRLVFDDPQARHMLDAIVHPVMLDIVEQDMRTIMQQKRDAPYFIVDAALLYELSLQERLDVVVLVQASLDACIERAWRRDALSADEVRRRYDAQMPVAEKRRRAHYIVENDGDLNELQDKVNALHTTLLERARQKETG